MIFHACYIDVVHILFCTSNSNITCTGDVFQIYTFTDLDTSLHLAICFTNAGTCGPLLGNVASPPIPGPSIRELSTLRTYDSTFRGSDIAFVSSVVASDADDRHRKTRG